MNTDKTATSGELESEKASARAQQVILADALADYASTKRWDPCEGCEEHLGNALLKHRRTIWRARRGGRAWHYYDSKANALVAAGVRTQ